MAEFEPTAEQSRIIEEFKSHVDLVIEAGAGTGKTSTLKLISATIPAPGIYFAYNKAIADEAAASFPKNVQCRTAHSLAFRAVGHKYAHRLNGPRLPYRVMAQKLGIEDAIDVGGKPILPGHLARLAGETVQQFCYSADRLIGDEHVPWIEGLEPDEMGKVRQYLAKKAQELWQDVVNPHGTMRFEHDHYLKIWGLSDPRLECDFVLLDEAQDANPVIADIVARQTHTQRVLVGDTNQAIYGWRGAIDAMREFDGQRLYLTQSFRFGQAVADEANKWLGLLEAELRISGFDKVNSVIGGLDLPDAVLCRSNAGAIGEVITSHAKGQKVAMVGGGDQIRRLAEAAEDLRTKGKTDHRDLFIFSSWQEVRDYVNEGGAGDLKTFVKMVDQLGTEAVIQAIDQLVSEQFADVVVSTVHKAKGREWGKVKIAGDFAIPEHKGEMSRAEKMLAYVAVTRAKNVLDRGGLGFVDGLIQEGGLA